MAGKERRVTEIKQKDFNPDRLQKLAREILDLDNPVEIRIHDSEKSALRNFLINYSNVIVPFLVIGSILLSGNGYRARKDIFPAKELAGYYRKNKEFSKKNMDFLQKTMDFLFHSPYRVKFDGHFSGKEKKEICRWIRTFDEKDMETLADYHPVWLELYAYNHMNQKERWRFNYNMSRSRDADGRRVRWPFSKRDMHLLASSIAHEKLDRFGEPPEELITTFGLHKKKRARYGGKPEKIIGDFMENFLVPYINSSQEPIRMCMERNGIPDIDGPSLEKIYNSNMKGVVSVRKFSRTPCSVDSHTLYSVEIPTNDGGREYVMKTSGKGNLKFYGLPKMEGLYLP